ncbi:tyrosine-protein kinase Wzc [Edaphovirga cremea]|uniref:tyrosine-protein kinase Wzc n=1 Tax=Edaphovirga cremea TaxID=2267246 RepID=UPI000DF01010|nr:tyrosine-protein kinase Wzc [Edaphovirga cremea]
MIDKNSTKNPEIRRDEEIDFRRILGSIIDNKWLIVAITTICIMIGIIYVMIATPIYKSDALIQVEKNTGSSLLSDLSNVLSTNQAQSTTEIELIQSRMVIGKTINDLDLDMIVEPKTFPIFGAGLNRLFGDTTKNIAVSRLEVPSYWLDKPITLEVLTKDSYRIEAGDTVSFEGKTGVLEKNSDISLLVSEIDAPIGTVFNITKKSELVAINNLLERFTVSDKGKDTGVLQLTLEGSSPVLIKKTLDSISQNYLQQNVERKSEEAGKSLEFLKEQLPLIRANLDESENKLNKYRQQNDSVDLSLEAKSVLDSMVSIETQLNELTFREAEISKLYTKEHPAYRALLEKRTVLEQEKEKTNKRVSGMPKTQQEILRLTRDVQAGQEVYMQLLNKQQELSINKASTIGNVRIVDPAETEYQPVKPKKFLVVLLLALLGSVGSVLYIIIKDLLHQGIESPEQLEEAGISVYASVPLSEWQRKKDTEFQLKRKRQNARSNQLLAIDNSADLAIEAIRSLRTSLHFAMLEAKNNILMISGATPAIGKTFVSANLAAVIAQSGKKVLLVDVDMRKGYVHEILGYKGDRGLSNVLSNQISVEEAVNKTEVAGLDFISRGQIPPNPSELLMNEYLVNFIKWARDNYDIVILDTPPILAVTDAAIISHHVGTSLLVARFEVNTLKEIEVSIRRFEQNGSEIKGVILNAVTKKAASYYGYGYNYYAYEYKSEK